MSLFYVDCRKVMASPSPRDLIAQLAFDRLHTLDFLIWLGGGLEIGSIPLTTCISDCGYTATSKREWRTFIVRKQP